MPAFDVAELQRDGFPVVPLPNASSDHAAEDDRIAASARRRGYHAAGEKWWEGITKSPAGGPGRYVILFVQA